MENKNKVEYPNEPFAEVLDDMGIDNPEDRMYFFSIVSLFAEEMYKDANRRKMEYDETLSAVFHWRVINPQRYFKVYITYIHSEDLMMKVDGFDNLTFDEYIQSIASTSIEFDADCGCTKIVNKNSSLAQNIEKPDLN